jgi:ribosomal protein S12 methylthiotransferase accessory factor
VHLPAECLHRLQSLPVCGAQACRDQQQHLGRRRLDRCRGALCRATLELVERDAYLRAWLAGTSAPLLADGSLPSGARLRVASLRAAGYRVALARVGGDWVPVVSVFVQRDEPAFTAITAAADFDPEAALHKALDEAEGRAAQACAVPAAPLASAREVQSIDAQCRFWQTPRFFRRADFYAPGRPRCPSAPPPRAAAATGRRLQSRLHAERRSLLAFELTPPGAAPGPGPHAAAGGPCLRRRPDPDLVPARAAAGRARRVPRGRAPARAPVRRLLRPPLHLKGSP